MSLLRYLMYHDASSFLRYVNFFFDVQVKVTNLLHFFVYLSASASADD